MDVCDVVDDQRGHQSLVDGKRRVATVVAGLAKSEVAPDGDPEDQARALIPDELEAEIALVEIAARGQVGDRSERDQGCGLGAIGHAASFGGPLRVSCARFATRARDGASILGSVKDESTTPTILVADDSAGQRAVVDMLLTVDGYRVVTVGDGREALDWLSKNTPQLAVLDVRMPHLDGIEICRRIKKVSRLHTVPVIVLTGMRDEATTVAAKAAGADAVVLKPLEGKDFRSTVRALVDRAAAPRPSPS